MEDRLYSSLWYRVEGLRPRLRSHAAIHRHHYRGELTYVLQDLATQRLHRFTPQSYSLIATMDGQRTLQEIWEMGCERLGDDAPTQDQMIQLLGQLHSADVLHCNVPPDTRELLERHDKLRRRVWLSQLMSPLFWRFPLFDPERFLQWGMPYVRPLFGRVAAGIWLAVVAVGVVLGIMHWGDLTESIVDRVLAPQNLLLLWLLFPVLKTVHEFGHAFAVKAFGGEVHVMGVMLLVVTPLPYVDASSASSFRSKKQRLIVGASGMMVETFVATLALILWLNVEPGLISAILYNIVFLASVSTILFNANPLLRFDGYYILSDLIEIPNLRTRSMRYLSYLIERYAFGRANTPAPANTQSERIWFVSYAVASFIYRILILVGIILFIASKFFFIGVLVALWSTIAWGVLPLVKSLKYLWTSPRLRTVRARAIGVTAATLATLLILLCLVPAPLNSRSEGVIWIPEQGIVRAGTDGFIERLVARSGDRVSVGDPLIICEDPLARARVGILEGEVAELEARYNEAYSRDRVEAQVIRDELEHRRKGLTRQRERLEALVIRSQTTGTFIVSQPEDLPGNFVRQGTAIAHVLDVGTLTVRVVVSQKSIDLVRHRLRGVEVKLSEELHRTLPAQVRREVPAASAQLPSTALGVGGGGQIAVDPFDAQGVRSIERHFQFDLELPSRSGIVNIGGRAQVRFQHGWEPLAYRWYRGVRRLFLSRFDV